MEGGAMRTISIIVLFSLFNTILFNPICYAQENQTKTKIAFLEFGAVNISPIVVGTISDEFRKHINKFENYYIMSNNRVKEILNKKISDRAEPITEPEEMKEIGKLLGADQVVSGTVTKAANLYTISVKLIDLRTNATKEKTGSFTGTFSDFVNTTVKDVAEKIVDLPQQEPGEEITQPVTTKKPWYKNWLVWAAGGSAVVVVVAIVFLGGKEDVTNGDDLPTPPEFP